MAVLTPQYAFTLLLLSNIIGMFSCNRLGLPWLLITRERGAYSSSEPVLKFADAGDIPQIKHASIAVARSTAIVAVRSLNHTILAYAWPNVSSLQIPIGAVPFNTLGSSNLFIIATGLAGDCRQVVRLAKEISLNLTYDYGIPPRGVVIAEEIGSFLQRMSSASHRPYACHIIIADGLHGCLYEIDLLGRVNQVWGACAGTGMARGLHLLETRWINDTMSRSSLEDIAKDVITSMLSAGDNKSKYNESTVEKSFDIRFHTIPNNNR
jgi:20S proteasome alpha/beta subunit